METQMPLPQSELQGLFQRFAAPFLDSPIGKDLGADEATKMAQVLWRIMIDGPEAEEEAFQDMAPVSPLAPGLLAPIRRYYEAEMKPLVTAEQLDSLRQWYAKGRQEGFVVGDQVRVQYGVPDPDYADLPLGGWAGTVVEIDDEGLCTIKLNQSTLDRIHPVFHKRCERDGLHVNVLNIYQEDLDPDLGEGLPLEEPTDIQTRPLDPKEPEDRIRAALGLTTDDAVPLVDEPTLRQYFDYLKANLRFPFSATYSHHDGKRRIVHHVSVIGLSDEFPIEDEHGLVCVVKDETEQWEVPVAFLTVNKHDANHQLLADYRRWFSEWGEFGLIRETVAFDDGNDDPEPPARKKTGRNDPCPCGSGKKFKKCCLAKQRSGGGLI